MRISIGKETSDWKLINVDAGNEGRDSKVSEVQSTRVQGMEEKNAQGSLAESFFYYSAQTK